MRILNNNKGSLLVILVICMTLIAVLGASFVSMIGSKQQGFVSLLNGQRANMVAKAGVEWAIRFASEGTDTNGNSIFFSNQTLTFTKDLIPGTIEGSFSTSYLYNTNTLTVTGTYQGVMDIITLSNFRSYLSPVTLIPDTSRKPSYRPGNRRVLDVPVMRNSDTTITQIDIATGISNVLLRYIYDPVGTRIFDYEHTNYGLCIFNPAPCDWFGYGILLSSSSTQLTTPNLQQSVLNYGTSNAYTFYFYDYAPSPAPLHTIKFYSTPTASEIRFRP